MLLTLCYRDYARSKQCVLKAVKQGCAIGDLMEEDLYNPFCIDGIDHLACHLLQVCPFLCVFDALVLEVDRDYFLQLQD